MAERADWLEEGIEICITLRSALEWQPEEEQGLGSALTSARLVAENRRR